MRTTVGRLPRFQLKSGGCIRTAASCRPEALCPTFQLMRDGASGPFHRGRQDPTIGAGYVAGFGRDPRGPARVMPAASAGASNGWGAPPAGAVP